MRSKQGLSKNNTVNIKKAEILVTGGSGSLGRNLIKRLLTLGAKNVVSISRDENLIKEAETEVGSSTVQFKLGDISDIQLISRLTKNADIIFHAAAVKHVTLAERNPRETHRINVVALLNLLDNSTPIKRFIHVSSDKAIGVMNCYGATKLLGEYLVRESNDLYEDNKYIIVRCPNLFGSRGSVLDIWRNQLRKDNRIKITDPGMTRYFITLPDAAKFIVETALKNNIDTKKIYYPLKSTQKFLLEDLAEAFIEVYGNKETKIEKIGAQPGEKKHEDYIEDVKLTPKSKLKKILRELK